MKTAIMVNRSVILAGSTLVLGVAALSFADSAHARDDVYWSVGVGSPGVSLNASNARPVYMHAQPVIYVQPAPVYYQPRPVYVRPAPVYVQPQAVYYQPQPVYYARPHGWKKRHGGHYVQGPRSYDGAGYYGPGHASVQQVVYQRDGRNEQRHDGRREDRRQP